jgi:Fur family ferric uptake transcriptional regulator
MKKHTAQQFKRYMATNKLKLTSQRKLIFDVFLETENKLSADELLQEVRKADPFVSLSTVYRTLKHMQRAGIAGANISDSGAVQFESAPCYDGHYMVCECCGKKEPLTNSYVAAIHAAAAQENGFTLHRCSLILYGTCKRCHKAQKN